MSEIKLSPQLFEDVQQAVIQHDAEAAEDVGLLLQYLSAVTGYLLGSQQFERAYKDAFLQELSGFTQHVMDDTDKKMQPATPPPAGNAMGYWEPPAKGKG
ncbi:MAG: hypothetical protein IZT60_00750 [Gammaproteobacteria bacterium]|nr:hypothetical protein [Gammaproteobacteria bacterium]